MKETYERKISSEEASEGYVLVLKDRLNYFPPVGDSFTLNGAPARVEARHCECRGPEKPHEHYFIRHTGLAKGQHVSITRSSAGFALSVS